MDIFHQSTETMTNLTIGGILCLALNATDSNLVAISYAVMRFLNLNNATLPDTLLVRGIGHNIHSIASSFF